MNPLRQKDYYEWLQICHEMITVNVNKIMVLPLLLLARCSHKACGLENRRSISLCPVQIWRFFMHMRWCEEATIYVQSLNKIVKNSNPHFFFAFTRICSCIIMQLFFPSTLLGEVCILWKIACKEADMVLFLHSKLVLRNIAIGLNQ